MASVATESFTDFARTALVRVRAGLIAGFGPERGAEATAEALAYAWEHWDRLRDMQNPSGYLYHVGRTHALRALRSQRRKPRLPSARQEEPRWVEPALQQVLSELPRRQREAVFLVHGYGYSLQDVADLWGVRRSTVQAHVDRALAKLRAKLGVDSAV